MNAAAALVLERATAPSERSTSARKTAMRCKTSAVIVGLELEIVTSRTGFDALESDWNDLFERAGTSIQLFQAFNWNWHWCNHYLPADRSPTGGPRLAILVGRRNGRAVMIWPLVTQKVAGLRQLSWMGEPVSQYGDVLIEESGERDALLAEGWRFIVCSVKPDIVNLRKVRADAAIAKFIGTIGAGITQSLVAPYLDLTSAKDFSEYEKRYSSQSRRNRKRLLRRLEEKHAIAFVEHTRGEAARALATTAIDLKRDWIKDRGLVSAAFSDGRIRDFFADVSAGEHKPADCRVSALTADGAPVALEIAVGCRDRIAMHVVVFDLAHEKSAVGVLLVEQSIRNCYRAGYGCYDLLAPGATYKEAWADGAIGVHDWALATTVLGKLYAKFYLGFARRHAKALIDRLPVSIRRRLLP